MKKYVKDLKNNMHSYIREITAKYTVLPYESFHVDTPDLVSWFLEDKIANEAREHFVVLCMNNKNRIVSYSVISIGTLAESIVHPRAVFTVAVLSGASGIIVAHNHPSGVLNPSKEDIDTTKRLVEAGKLLGITVMDHLIVGFNNGRAYFSMKEHGFI